MTSRPPLKVVPVEVGERSYDVVIGAGATSCLAELLPSSVEQVAVVTQEGIGVEISSPVGARTFVIPDGEPAKSLKTVEFLCSGFAQAGLARSDALVAVGGGVVTDVAGFAAASYHRGISYINVATTLLAQVDAAVGGKTGVNLPEGKNLVGAFWQPTAVICDTDTLATLSSRQWASGRGEMAKYAFLPGGSGLGILEEPLPDQVARCVEIKAGVVSADEREGGRRMILNYGHTLAHALEALAFGRDGEPGLSHGEAVAVGLVFAAMLARNLGRIDEERVELHRKVVTGFGLDGRLPADVRPDEIVSLMRRDKKASHDLTFVLDGPSGVEPVRGVDPSDVVGTVEEMASEYGRSR